MVVGILADAEDDDADEVRADFTVIREVLDRAGAGPWAEPELTEKDVVWFDMGGIPGCTLCDASPFTWRSMRACPSRYRAGGRRTTHCSERPTPIHPGIRPTPSPI